MKRICIGVLITLMLICCALPSFAQSTTTEADKYGSEFFAPIEGEVTGQAAPGVQQVKINGQEVKVSPKLTFSAKVALKQDEQYLNIETTYQNLRFTKRYLVIRHPKAEKTFKITVVAAPPPAPPTTLRKPKKQLVIIDEQKPKPVKSLPPREIVEPDEQLVITAEPLPSNLAVQSWRKIVAWLKTKPAKSSIKTEAVSPEVIRQIVTVNAADQKVIEVIQQQTPLILRQEIEKIISRDVPTGAGLKVAKQEILMIIKAEAPAIIREQSRSLISDKFLTREYLRQIEDQATTVLIARLKQNLDTKEIQQIANRAAREAALNAVNQELVLTAAREAIRSAAINIIDEQALKRLAEETVKAEARKLLDRDQLRKIAELALREAVNQLLSQEAGTVIRDETQQIMTERLKKAQDKVAEQLKGVKIHQLESKQPFDLILELAPNKMLLVREVNGKYIASVLDTKTKAWAQLNEISAEEFRTLLETGTLPATTEVDQ